MNSDTNPPRKKHKATQALSTFTETFGLSRTVTIIIGVVVTLMVAAAVFWFIYSAPPKSLTITAGPPDSSFARWATNYQTILASNHITLKILPSDGSIENIRRLGNPKFHVSLGFVLAGETNTNQNVQLHTLGSVGYQPLIIFYRGESNLHLLSDFTGKRLAVGKSGSGAHTIAMALLRTNGIVRGGPTVLTNLEADAAAKALTDGEVDAAFFMGDSASPHTITTLLHTPGIHMFDFAQADAYTRRFDYLTKLDIPRGGIDFASDTPPHDVNLVGPTVDLIIRSRLHPALIDLLLEAAQETHGAPTLLQRRGEFPAQIEHEFKLSPEAVRWKKSGQTYLYRSLPFWLASLINQVLVAIVPMLIVLIPGLRLIPTVYKWRVQIRIYRWYRNLLRVEHDLSKQIPAEKRAELLKRLDNIEVSVNAMRVPASFASQFYGLREHIGIVRGRLGTG